MYKPESVLENETDIKFSGILRYKPNSRFHLEGQTQGAY